MAAGGKTTSTERLLDIIRGKGKGDAVARAAAGASQGAEAPVVGGPGAGEPAGGGAAKAVSAAPKAGARRLSLSASRPAKGGGSGVVVGVDIGSDCLRLAKVSQSGGKSRLQGVARVPYPPGESPEASSFPGFMASEIRKFAGGGKGYECWSLISSAKAELWHVLIPKVPRGQIQEAVFWTVKKEKQFDEREFLLDFEVQGEVMDKGQPKFSIMVYLAPRKQVEDLKALFARAGMKLGGATISPIAIQTLFRSQWISAGAKTYAHLYVGRNWSRIDILIDGNIVLSRGIKAGTNSMVEALLENYNMSARNGGGELSMPGDSVINLQLDDETMLSPSGAPRTLSGDQAKQVLRAKLLEQPMQPGDAGAELSEQDVLRMIRPAVERLVRQVERTFEYHTTTMGKDRVEKIFFSGEICTNQLLIDFIHSQLGIANQLMDPLAPGGQASTAASSLSVSERLDYNLVVALGLSNNTITPNLLFTYRDKEKQRQLKRVDLVVFFGFMLAVGLLGGVYLWQQSTIGQREAELRMQQTRLAQYKPPATEEELLKWARMVNEKNKQLKRASKIYESLSVFKEIAELTPPEVRIVSLDMEYGTDIQNTSATKKAAPKSATARVPRLLVLDGVVLGNPENYELILTSFLIRLENSKLFGLPIIHKRAVEDFSTSGPVLRFTVHINMM